MCCGLDKAAKLARPASEHAREEALEVAATALSLHTSWSKAEMAWALQTLASALAVVEQERAQRDAAIEKLADDVLTAAFLSREGVARAIRALAVSSSEPAGEQG